MKHSSCPCCSDQRVWAAVEGLLGSHNAELRYCPVCSTPAAIRETLVGMRKQLDLIDDIIVDENGNPMILDRKPWSGKGPRSYEIDLDKIDISREMAFLEKHHDMENARKADLFVEHVVNFYKRKYGEEE